jgi:hypothetical protein
MRGNFAMDFSGLLFIFFYLAILVFGMILAWRFVRAFESIAKRIALIAAPPFEEIHESENKESEMNTTSANTQMHEAGQSIIDKIKKILLGVENNE